MKEADGMEFLTNNHIFSVADYLPLLCEMEKKYKAGLPMMVRRQMTTVDNAWWGVKGGRRIDMVFYQLNKASEFEKLLPQETQNAISQGMIQGLNKFPNFKTVFQNGLALTKYTA